jgi:Xaa-Pro aminopeptidase
VLSFAAQVRERFFGFDIVDATPILHGLRQRKTPYEQDVLRKSVAISSEAHLAGMKAADIDVLELYDAFTLTTA